MPAYVDSMAWAESGGVPWHKEGHAVSDDLTPDEMAEAAGITWTVSKRPSYTIEAPEWVEGVGLINDPNHNHIVRDDTNAILGVCSPDGWHPFQNTEIMQFYKRFCEAGQMQMETAGSLREGKDIWALAKYSDGFTLPGGDEVKGYCLVSNSHKPGKAFKILNTPIRVVCWNTLNMALQNSTALGGMFRLAHRVQLTSAIFQEAEKALGLATEQLDDFQQQTEFLASKQITPEQFERFVAQLFAQDLLQDEQAKGFDGNIIPLRDQFKNGTQAQKVYDAFENSPGADLKAAKGTYWGAVNAVTYAMDHQGAGQNALYDAWYGRKATHKRDALTLATEMAEAA